MTLIGLLAVLVVVGLCFWAVRRLSGTFGIPAPIITVFEVGLVIVTVLYLLSAFGVGLPALRLR